MSCCRQGSEVKGQRGAKKATVTQISVAHDSAALCQEEVAPSNRGAPRNTFLRADKRPGGRLMNVQGRSGKQDARSCNSTPPDAVSSLLSSFLPLAS